MITSPSDRADDERRIGTAEQCRAGRAGERQHASSPHVQMDGVWAGRMVADAQFKHNRPKCRQRIIEITSAKTVGTPGIRVNSRTGAVVNAVGGQVHQRIHIKRNPGAHCSRRAADKPASGRDDAQNCAAVPSPDTLRWRRHPASSRDSHRHMPANRPAQR